MTTLPSRGYKAMKATHRDVAELENKPPPTQGLKRTASIAGLFEQGGRLRRKQNEKGIDEKTSRGLDVKTASDGFFASFNPARKTAQNPLYTNFKDAANVYRRGVGSSTSEHLEPVCQALVARVHGLDLNGNPIKTPGVPTLQDIDALDNEHESLSAPLSEEVVPIELQQADGSVVTKHIKLERTLRAFERRHEQKQAEITTYKRELDRVLAEITAVQQKYAADVDDDIEQAKKQHETEKVAIHQRAEVLLQQTMDEIEHAQKEDRAATAETNRRFQDFMKALQ